jgi:ligand-binding sensor domain-containing protein
MKLHPGLLCLLIFLLQSGVCHPQVPDYYIHTYRVENGLAYNNVKDIARDRTGFMWIATFDGLSRFDGYEFRNYYHDPENPASVGDINLSSVCVDRQNHVWVKGAREISRYDPSSDRFIRYSPASANPVSSEVINAIALDTAENLWIWGEHGFSRYSREGNKFLEVPVRLIDTADHLVNVSHFGFSTDNTAWFISGKILYRASVMNSGKTGREALEIRGRYDFDPWEDQIIFQEVRMHYITTPAGNTWILSNNGLFLLRKGARKVNRVKTIEAGEEFPGLQRLIWSDPANGTFLYLIKEKKLILLPDESLKIAQALFDDGKILWIGSINNTGEGAGLSQVIFPGNRFHHTILQTDEKKPLAVFAVAKDNHGNTWVGGRGIDYLIRIDRSGNIIKCNVLAPGQVQKGTHPRSVIAFKDRMFVGFFKDFFYSFDPSLPPERLKTLGADPFSWLLKETPIHSFKLLSLDRSGRNLLVAGQFCLSSVDLENHRVNFSFSRNLGPDIFSLFDNDDNTYWVGSVGAIYRVNANKMTIREIPLFEKKYNVESIVGGDSCILWLALMGGGLDRFNTRTLKSTMFTTKDGLANNFTYNILKDSRGGLWISTNQGISRFDPGTEQFRNYSLTDGLKIVEFNADAAFQGSDGEMIFGGMGGIVSFYPDSLIMDSQPFNAPLVISDFRVGGIPVATEKDINELNILKLKAGSKDMQISFSKLDYVNSDKIRYRYRLIGEKEDWIVTDSRHRSVNYAGIAPGDYELQLEATDIFGNWISKRSLAISIAFFFYQTLWFKSLIVILVLLLAGLYYRMKLRQVRLSEIKKQEELKLESLRGQMNPHFIFNSLNSINYFISTSDRISANSYITGFSRLIRSILTNSATEFIPMDKELESLEDYFKLEHLRFGDKFDYSVEVDPSVNPMEIEISPTMVQPFAENAIWHGVRSLDGRKGFIRIRYREKHPDHLVCTIEDDGVGRKLSGERKTEDQRRRKSKGIGIIQQRLALINSIRGGHLKLTFEDAFPDRLETGTRVIIEIPVKKERG